MLLTIENKNRNLPISVAFDKIPQFKVAPSFEALLPNQKSIFTVSFSPINVGIYNKQLDVLILEG